MTGGTDESIGRGELRLTPALHALDHATLRVEKPVRRLAGSARLNPLPHAGTISVLLLGVVVVSGLYITLFYEYGHVASYESVASMEAHAIQRVVRALHRYSSAALVVTTLIHGWRIFTAARFVGRQRRFRWATGVAAVVLVWLTGVTGYWLIWDVRAQALNELVIGFVGQTETGAGVAIDHLGVLPGPSGSSFMLTLWFIHLGLTALIGYFMYRHLRRSNLPWLPPRHMAALMGGALLLVSLAMPVGMLAPASSDRLIGEIPLDPFVLFLLPPLLTDGRWWVLALLVALLLLAMGLPRLLQRRDPETIVIDEQACTGCELCVVDCPYQALTLRTDRTGAETESQIAVVDESRCVSCGICLGSCAFGAIDLPGFDPAPALDIKGKSLVIACDRHLQTELSDAEDVVIHRIGCAGAMSPETVKLFAEQGATAVQVVGCAPEECQYGVGNRLAAERLSGTRSPHPARRYARIVTQDWVPNDRLLQALQAPGSHPSADGRQAPKRREALVGAGLLAAASAIGIAFATRAPFQTGSDEAALRLVVDHQSGQSLRANPETGPIGSLSAIELTIDQERIASFEPARLSDRWVAVIDVDPSVLTDAARADTAGDDDQITPKSLQIYGVVTETRTLLFERQFTATDGERVLIDLTDVDPLPTVADGRQIFNSRTGGCTVCHSVESGDDGVGPSLAGVASVAGDRVEGLSAEQYLRQSILLPDQYVVDGWPAGQMLPIYRERFTPEQVDAVVSYLMTLKDPDLETEEGP